MGYYSTAKLYLQYKYHYQEGLYYDRLQKYWRTHSSSTHGKEAVGVGTSHISHIETGSGKASLETIIQIINALDCSADELLCIEVKNAKPYLNNWLSELVADCDPAETKLIVDTVTALKSSLRRLKITEE